MPIMFAMQTYILATKRYANGYWGWVTLPENSEYQSRVTSLTSNWLLASDSEYLVGCPCNTSIMVAPHDREHWGGVTPQVKVGT